MWKNVFLLFLIFLAACGVEERMRPDSSVTIRKEEVGPKVYTVVRDGETLASVAHHFTGSAANWRVLAQGNPQITSPRLKKGEQVFIPQALLIENRKQPKREVVIQPQETIPQPVSDRILMEQPAAPVTVNNQPENRQFIGIAKGDSVTIVRDNPQEEVEPKIVPKQYKQIRNDLIDEFLNDAE